MNMAKAIFGWTAMIFLFSAPAHGQMRVSSNASIANSGGSGMGGSGVTGSASLLPHAAPASFGANTVSGSDAEFRPSDFVTFDKAVAEGKVHIAAAQKTVAQAAAETRQARQAKAKILIAQDDHGNVIISKR